MNFGKGLRQTPNILLVGVMISRTLNLSIYSTLQFTAVSAKFLLLYRTDYAFRHTGLFDSPSFYMIYAGGWKMLQSISVERPAL